MRAFAGCLRARHDICDYSEMKLGKHQKRGDEEGMCRKRYVSHQKRGYVSHIECSAQKNDGRVAIFPLTLLGDDDVVASCDGAARLLRALARGAHAALLLLGELCHDGRERGRRLRPRLGPRGRRGGDEPGVGATRTERGGGGGRQGRARRGRPHVRGRGRGHHGRRRRGGQRSQRGTRRADRTCAGACACAELPSDLNHVRRATGRRAASREKPAAEKHWDGVR